MPDQGDSRPTLTAERLPSSGPPDAAAPVRRWLSPWGLLKLAVLVPVLALVARALVRQLGEVPWRTLEIRPQALVLAMGASGLASLFSAMGYRALLALFLRPPSIWAMCTVVWLPVLGKYVPGKVASLSGAAWLLHRYRVPAGTAAGVVVLQQGLWILTGLLVAAPLCLWEPIRQRLPLAWAWCLAAMSIGITLAHPRVLGPLANFVLRKLKRPVLAPLPPLRGYLPPVLLMAAAWAAQGLAIWLVARSLFDISAAWWPVMTAAIALASSLGLLALFAPGGIGVQEGVLLVVLAPVTGAMTALVAVVMRLVQTVEDVLLAFIAGGIFWALQRREHERD